MDEEDAGGDIEEMELEVSEDLEVSESVTLQNRIVWYLRGDATRAFQKVSLPDWMILMLFILIFIVLGIPTCILLVITNELWDSYGFTEWSSLILSTAPLIAVELCLGIPPVSDYMSHIIDISCTRQYGDTEDRYFKWIYITLISLIIPITWSISGIFFIEFNPLSFVYILFTTFGSLELALRIRDTEYVGVRGLSGADLLLFVLLFAPLDYRWIYTDYYYGPPHLGYDWWAIAITVHGVICYLLFAKQPSFGYRLIPTWKDILIGGLFLVLLGLPVIPLGLLSGFLKWDEFIMPSFLEVFSLWWENVVSIAITEELFFRVILMTGLNTRLEGLKYNKGGWIGLLFSATVFGLMHLPRRNGDVISQILYASFAFISGFCYGGAYIVSGNNIIAPVITHSLTDTLWAFLFR